MNETESQAIVVRETQAVGQPLGVNEILAQVRLIQDVMKSVMSEGEHFGTIPGCGDKKTLLQPGAQKLTMTFRLAPEYQIKETNMERGHKEYRVICTLRSIQSGSFVGQGVGVCSSMESKYRWRGGSRKCPNCGKETIIKGKVEYGGGWLCYGKKGGCGAKWADGAQEIESQSIDKVENDNPADTFNTVLKMAKKRAFVDATITATAASDIFTQDIGDEESDAETPQKPAGGVQTPSKQEKRAVEPAAQPYKASADELPMDGKTPLAKDQDQADRATLLATLRKLAGGNEKYFLDFLRENKTKQGTYTLMPNESLDDLSLDMLRYCVNNFAEFSDKVSQWVADKAGAPSEQSDNNDLPEGTKSITGELAMVTVRDGTTKGKAWTRYGLTVNGMEMACFDKTMGQIAQKIKGKQVRIDYGETEKGKNVLRLTEVS